MRWLAGLLVLAPLSVVAHHSRSAFDLDNSIAVEGVVTEVGWTNPHYYLGVREEAADGAVAWTFEGHSIPGLVRNGWSKSSLAIGERVRVVANPNQDANTPFGLLDHVTRTDGKTFYSFKRPPADQPAPAAPLQPATSMAGTWRLIRSLRANLVGVFEPPADWPLLPAAQAEVDAFDLRDDPALRCEPLGLPRMLTWPYAQHWRPRDGGYAVEIEHSREARRVLAQTSAAEGGLASRSGVSQGALLPDGSYEVVTRGFVAQPWGNGRGISSSVEKQITERYTLVEGGYQLRLDYTLVDPVYLAAPVTASAHFRRVRDYDFAEEPACDVATATRHLEFEE